MGSGKWSVVAGIDSTATDTSNDGADMTDKKHVSSLDLAAMKRAGQKIVMLTAYDALFGRLVDESGADVILVGDSVTTVLCGEQTTIPATLDQMIYHGRI